MNIGIEKAMEAARAIGADIAIPELDGGPCDFNDLMRAKGVQAVRSAIKAASPLPPKPTAAPSVSSGTPADELAPWPNPRPLEDPLPPVEVFSPELLPDALRPWVLDVAERMQAPVEYVAVSAMVALGAALGRKVGIRPKRLDDSQECGNLWGLVIGPPSSMKSPAVNEGMRPLAMLERADLEAFEAAHREWEAQVEAAKLRHDGAKDRARSAARKGGEIEAKDLIRPLLPDEPRPPRLIVNDVTVPAVVDVLRDNPTGVLAYRDELAGFIADLDREGMESARPFYLSAWSGKEGYTQDRIGRGTNLRVPHVYVSILGGIQPARVAPLLRECLATGGGDGFLPRFSLAVWPDPPREYRKIDREPNEEARRAAYEVYKRLHTLRADSIGAVPCDDPGPFLRLEDAAVEVFVAWEVDLKNRLRAEEEDSALSAHLLKYPKMVCALALLCHLADGGTGLVTHGAVERALAWVKVLESHARRMYASLGHANVEAARALRRHLQRGDLQSPFGVREVYRRGWAHLSDREAAYAAVDLLDARGWLRSEEIQTGGRPSVLYHAHPTALRRLDS